MYLDAVLEAVKLKENKSVIEHVGLLMEKLTSQQELAIWQPAWPTEVES